MTTAVHQESTGDAAPTQGTASGTTGHVASPETRLSGRTMSKNARFIAALLVSCAFPPSYAADQLPAAVFTSKATGALELSVMEHSPLYAEVERSPALSSRLVEALASKGFTIARDKGSAKAVLIFRGDIALLGGPNFAKGIKVGIGDAVEKSLQAAKDAGGITQADVVQTVAALAINKAAFDAAISPFWKGLALSGMASAVGESTGLKGSFNKALTGDARGVCLSRCEDWNKVNQTVYLWIGLQAGDIKSEVRVLTKVFSEIVAPEFVMDRALADGLGAVRVVDRSASQVEARP